MEKRITEPEQYVDCHQFINDNDFDNETVLTKHKHTLWLQCSLGCLCKRNLRCVTGLLLCGKRSVHLLELLFRRHWLISRSSIQISLELGKRPNFQVSGHPICHLEATCEYSFGNSTIHESTNIGYATSGSYSDGSVEVVWSIFTHHQNFIRSTCEVSL